MKKIFASILLILYTFASSGAIVQMHFCSEELSNWSFNKSEGFSCCCQERELANTDSSDLRIEKANNCCEDTIISLSLEDQNMQWHNGLSFLFSSSAVFPTIVYSIFEVTFINKDLHHFPKNNSPPITVSSTPLYILYQNFKYLS